MAAVLRWMFVLLLLLLVGGGGAAYWFYTRSDEGLRLMVLSQLRTMAPNLNVDIDRAHFDLLGRVVIYGLTARLHDDDDDHPLLEVPELTATLEPTQLTGFENVVIQKLHLVKPRLHLIRGPDETWNWRRIVFESTPGGTVPDLDIANAAVLLEFQLPGRRSRKLAFQNFNLTSCPADSKRLLIQASTLLEPAGPLTVEIETALDGSSWKVESRGAWHVPVDGGLVRLLADLSPGIADKVALAGKWIDDVKMTRIGSESSATQSGFVSNSEPQSQRSSSAPDFGIRCVSDINFVVQKTESDRPLTFQVLAVLAEGAVENDLLPFSLSDVSGKIYLDNRQIIVRELHAAHGPTQIAFKGDVIPGEPIKGILSLKGVELNNALKSRMTDSLRKIVNSLGLTGICDTDLTFSLEEGVWKKRIELQLSKGTVTHERFPVTVREVTGTLRLENNVVGFKAAGKYAGQTVEARGKITNPGPEQRADIEVKSNNLPMDDESLAACPVPVRKAIEALNLTGRHDFLLKIHRPEGEGHKYEPELFERLYDGSLCFNGFPYTVHKLQGQVHWIGDLVEFREIKGVHDDAVLTASGNYNRSIGPGRLKLKVDATDAEFDRSLEKALPATLRQVWDSFQPLGNFNIITMISWTPGEPCEVVVPSINVRNCEVLMKCFPWVLHTLNGEFSFNTEPGKLVIKDVTARHDDTHLSVRGTGWFPHMKPWRLEFKDLIVDNLVPNTTFRNALPDALQRTFDFLRPTGAYWFSGPVEFSGQPDANAAINAAWKLKTIMYHCAIDAGSRIEDINGEVQLNGSWDGKNAKLDGDLKLDSASIFGQGTGRGYEISRIHGPITFRDNKFVAGFELPVSAIPSNKPPMDKRISGDVIGGKVFLDAVVDFGAEVSYRAYAELQNGRLETFAQRYLRGQSKLAGLMNGWLSVRGKGTKPEQMQGDGHLDIAPAALYELPLFAQIFQILQLQSADRTAFQEAKMDFKIANARFDINSIEMEGDSLQVRGRGFVRFDGGMQMGFGISLRQLIPNPFKSNLLAVKVTGNVGDPKTEKVLFPDLFPEWDGAMRQFMRPFSPRRMAPNGGMGQNPAEPIR